MAFAFKLEQLSSCIKKKKHIYFTTASFQFIMMAQMGTQLLLASSRHAKKYFKWNIYYNLLKHCATILFYETESKDIN